MYKTHRVVLRRDPCFQPVDCLAGTLSRPGKRSMQVVLRALPFILSGQTLCLTSHAALRCLAEGFVLAAMQQVRVIFGDGCWVVGHLIADLRRGLVEVVQAVRGGLTCWVGILANAAGVDGGSSGVTSTAFVDGGEVLGLR